MSAVQQTDFTEPVFERLRDDEWLSSLDLDDPDLDAAALCHRLGLADASQETPVSTSPPWAA